MGYKGIEFISQENYIFSDTIPYNPEFNIEELKLIENKIEDYVSGSSGKGISEDEAEIFLDWITFNARNYAVRDIPESAITASMLGQCAPTQRINYKILKKIGLDVRAFNIADCIGDIPINDEDRRKMENGWGSPALRHSVALVNIPIVDNKGNTELRKVQLDPTFRQFCIRKNCDYSNFFEIDRVAPHPGYFMTSDNLLKLGVTRENAIKTENLCKQIIKKGYFYLTEENAKLYGDAFVRASTRLQFQGSPINMTGKEYIKNFEDTPMDILKVYDSVDSKYTALPSEMLFDKKEQKRGIFSKILDFFKGKNKNKDILALPEGIYNKRRNRLENVQLSEEEMRAFRAGERQSLDLYNNEKNQENSRNQGFEIPESEK